MMRYRDIQTHRVIEEVRKRRCIWDASDAQYKNREARLNAWDEILNTLFPNPEEEEKPTISKHIQQRWKTARDAYIRTKTATKNNSNESSDKKLKKYVFYDMLGFLSGSVENTVDDDSNHEYNTPLHPDTTVNTNSIAPVAHEDTKPSINTYIKADKYHNSEPSNMPALSRPRTQKRKIKLMKSIGKRTSSERELMNLLAKQTPNLNSDDLAFFSSLNPILKSFDIDQKIEFRARVLNAAYAVRNMHPGQSNPASISNVTPEMTSQSTMPHQYGPLYNLLCETPCAPGYETSTYSTH